MNVLSLFDGMSCGQIALKELGINIDNYFASEVDKFAIAQTQLNFPDTIQLGDVRNISTKDLPKIDLLIGGSPCQSFSFAGKRKGMITVENEEIYTLDRYLELKRDGFEFEGQSYLFWEYMRILTEIRENNPDVLFLLENVEMGKKWERVLSEAIGIFGVHINSALVSAQNRKRIYWTNIRTKREGIFGELHSDIPQPEDRGLFLRDVLDDVVDEKYYISDESVKNLIKYNERNKEKGNGFSAVFHKPDMKMSCLRVGGRRKDDLVCVPTIIQIGRGFNQGGVFKDKSPTLTGNSWERNNFVVSGTIRSFGGGKTFRPMVSGKSPTLLARARQDGNGQPCVMLGNRIRYTTPTEFARLQTIPDWYRWKCSKTQQYKMLGNGWTVEVIKHIFSFITIKSEQS